MPKVGDLPPATLSADDLIYVVDQQQEPGSRSRKTTVGALAAFIQPATVPDGPRGDITVSNLGSTWTIEQNAVTFGKIQTLSPDTLVGRTAGAGSPEAIPCTAAGRALLDDADAAAQRATLGLGTAAVADSTNFAPAGAQYIVSSADGTLTAERVLTDTATVTWDTGVAGEVRAIVPDASVTNAKLAPVTGPAFKGRDTGAGAPQDLTPTAATALLNPFSGDAGAGGLKGLVPAPAAGDAAASKYLRADGGWAAVTAATVTNAPSGGIAATNVQSALNELDSEKLDKTGGTITGELYVIRSGAESRLTITADSSNLARVALATNSVPRWSLLKAGVESGGNTGSSFYIEAADDSGNFLGYALEIPRTSRKCDFKAVPSVNGSDLPFTKSFTSSQQPITSAGSLVLAHGLGEDPKIIQCHLVCITGEAGYSVNDKLAIHHSFFGSAATSNRGISLVFDATNINIRYGSYATVFIVLNKNDGVGFGLTNANWRLVVRAWA